MKNFTPALVRHFLAMVLTFLIQSLPAAKETFAREAELQKMLSERTGLLDRSAELRRQRQEILAQQVEPASGQLGRSQALAQQLAGLDAQIAQNQQFLQNGDRGLRALVAEIRAQAGPEKERRERMLAFQRQDKEQTEAIYWLTLGFAELKDPKTKQTRVVRILDARPPTAKILDPQGGERRVPLADLTGVATPAFDPSKVDNWVWVSRSVGPPTPCRIVKGSIRGDQAEVEWWEEVKGKNVKLTKPVLLSELRSLTEAQKASHDKSRLSLLKSLQTLQDALKVPGTPGLALAHSVAESLDHPNTISKHECDQIAFDNRNKMAEDTDQLNSSLCWAHAAAGLLEEQLCLAEPKYCGERVARSEIAGQTYVKQNSHRLAANEGGKPAEGLRHYLDPRGGGQKVCLDKYGINPYDVGDERYLRTLKSLFKEYQAKTASCRGGAGGGTGLDQAFFNKFFADFRAIHEFLHLKEVAWTVIFEGNRMLDNLSFLQLLQASKSENEFVQKVLLFYCQGVARKDFTRKAAPPLAVVEHYLFNPAYDPGEDRGDPKAVPMEPYLAELRTAKRSGHSVALGICYYSLVRDAGLRGRTAAELASNPDKCGGHAVVANGARWNQELQRCELHVKNSHGADATLKSDWYDAQTVLSHSKGVSYYRFTGR